MWPHFHFSADWDERSSSQLRHDVWSAHQTANHSWLSRSGLLLQISSYPNSLWCCFDTNQPWWRLNWGLLPLSYSCRRVILNLLDLFMHFILLGSLLNILPPMFITFLWNVHSAIFMCKSELLLVLLSW